jgi:hypothetical protein
MVIPGTNCSQKNSEKFFGGKKWDLVQLKPKKVFVESFS